MAGSGYGEVSPNPRSLGAAQLHTLQTVLVFAGVPAAVVAVITGLVFAGSADRNRRYRPGRPFVFTPVWFLSAPAAADPDAPASAGRALGAGADSGRAAIADRALPGDGPGEWPARDRARLNVTGGASDRW
jgi:hypothetical protein